MSHAENCSLFDSKVFEEIGAWTISSLVPVLVCDLWKAVVDWCMEVLPPIMTVNFGPTCKGLLLPEGGKAETSG